MRIIKPLRLGLLTRPYTLRRQHRLGVSVLALATLDDPAFLLPEAELWRLTSEALEEDNVVDLAVPKPCAEFLVSGQAWEHRSETTGSAALKVCVAGLEKSLIVHGDRRVTPNGVSRAAPVRGVPVDWSHTYGGVGHEENPAGMGAGRLPDGGWALPNVEPLTQRMAKPGQAGRPVSFGPVSPIRPRRFKRSGEYDPAWLENGFPGFPDTLDPHFFNAAEPDQWLVGQEAFEPGTEYTIWNMHPDRPCVQGRLPRWLARCFIMRHGHDGVEEVPMRHTTAWFFPGRAQVILMFHGAVPTVADDASDIAVIMPALDDHAQTARSPAHFEQVLKLRLEPESGPLHAFRDKDLLPEAALRDEDFMRTDAMNSPLAVNQRARAKQARADAHARIRAAGHDPDDYGLDSESSLALTSLDDLPDLLRRARRESRLAKAAMLRKRRETGKKLGDDAAGSTALEAAQAEPPGGPPHFKDSVGARSMLATAEDFRAERRAALTGPPSPYALAPRPANRAIMEPEEVETMLDRGQDGMARLYLTSAHLRTPAATAPGGRSVRMRRRVEALMRGSRDLSGLDLTGVDLSGLDLSGARCRGTWMEMADLSHTRLAGADLSEAVLTRARLLNADLDEAVFKNANLGGVQAHETSFARACFEDTVLDEAVFSGCGFEHALISQCIVAGAEFSDCRYVGARLNTVTFCRETRFERVDFANAALERVVWLDCDLDALRYDHARLTACAWVQSRCDTPPAFEHAHLLTCCAVQTGMPGAVFTHAWLQECSLRAMVLDGACFKGARLQTSDLSESSLRESDFRRCDAEGSLLMGCNLTGADLREADLIDVIASKSDFRFADLGGANLFRADISQSILDAGTRTTNAYVKWAKTLPAAKEETA